MIQPTRTNLLLLRERSRSVTGSIGILKGRRQALVSEFLAAGLPLLRSREELRAVYGRAIEELQSSLAIEGEACVASLATPRDLGVEIAEGNVMGVRYREVSVRCSPVRSPAERGYDEFATTAHLEEATHRFETIVATMLDLAAFEAKLKRLGEELLRLTRRIRVLEERILPALMGQIRTLARQLAERERESHYRLKRFKARRGGLTRKSQ